MSARDDYTTAAENHIEALAEIAAVHDQLPKCPTCGGKGYEYDWLEASHDCPDCVDGKVTFERLVAVFNAVWDTNLDLATTDHRNAYDYLRGIR